MKKTVEGKLDKISTIWNNYIIESRLCYEQINLENNEIPPHFGSIIGHFSDTFDIVYKKQKSGSYTAGFINDIGFLQTIFVHQDLVRELLGVFQIKFNLWKDENYSINRSIRNELIGHPISRESKGDKTLVSSTLFSYQSEPESITYLRYHKDNQYKFEMKSYKRDDIIKRHTTFLNEYFDKILIRLKQVLEVFQTAVEQLGNKLETLDFKDLLKESSISYELIFDYEKIYDKDSLLNIYGRQSEHLRYKNLIDVFLNDITLSLKGCKRSIIRLFDPEEADRLDNSDPLFKLVEISESNSKSYQPALGKLGARDGLFDLESRILKSECDNNEEVIIELDHMRANIQDDIEYYCSYYLICQILKA